MTLQKQLEDLPLKEFKVTVYPKPATFTVLAQTKFHALGMAEMDYASGDVSRHGFWRHDVTDLEEVAGWETQHE